MSRLKMNSNPNHNYIRYISNFAYCTLYCVFCSLCLLSGESVGHDMDGVNKKYQISDDEIIHRHQLVAPYLLSISEKQKDWIETYHLSFDGDWQGISSDNNIADSIQFSTSKSIPLNPKEHSHRDEIDDDFPPELNNLDIKISHLNSKIFNSEISSRHFDEVKNIVSNNKFEINTKKSISEHRTVDSTTPEFTNIEKDLKIHPLTASSSEQDASVDGKILGSVSRENIVTEESEKENIYFDLSKNAGKEKIIETRDVNSETKQLKSVPSEFGKPESVSPKDKLTFNSEDIHSNPKIVDAPSSELSKPYLDQTESNQLAFHNTKEKSLNTVQELTDLKDKEFNSHKIEDSVLFEVTPDKKDEESSNIISVSREEINRKEEIKVKLPIVNEELLKRQRLVKAFVAPFNKQKENGIETYQFNYYKETNSGEAWESLYSDSHILDQEVENIAVKVLEPLQNQERLYFIRWLNKLLNKFANYPYNKYISINFLFTTDILNNLKKLSESKKCDIHTADELISELISNATVHYGYNFNDFCDMFANVSFYIVVGIIFSVLLYFILYYYPISRFILPLLIFVSWHGFKMYQEKVAQKHATVSAIAPAYCESILTTESGIFAHIKEYIRSTTYDEHCKTYFKALMIDPLSELSLPIVLADFVSATFFQLFLPMAHALNAFVKILFFDLSFIQTFYLFMLVAVLVFFCIVRTLICNRYKLKFPFFMGSLEPSATPVGSKVEELVLENNTIKASPVKFISDKYDTLFIHEKRDCVNSPMLHKNDCQTMKLMQLSGKRRFSF